MGAHLPNSRLRDLITQVSVGPVRCGAHEILRRIFITVRDCHWREIVPIHWDSQICESQRTAYLSARHRSELADFEWHGSLQVSDDLCAIRFAFEGRVLRDMEVCRLGLIVLHPVDSLIDARLTAKGPQGDQHLTVAAHIHPQPIINGIPGAMTEPFSELTIKRDDVGTLDLRFGGELFEFEDQRNWGDASFKTYCTPLRLGFPRAVKAGTSVAQSVDVRFQPAPTSGVRRSSAKSGSSYSAQGTVPLLTAAQDRPFALLGRFPTIGREWRKSLETRVPDKDGPAWQHIHLDITRSEGAAALAELLESSSRATCEIAVEVRNEQTPLAERLALPERHRGRIARLLIYGPGTSLPSANAIERCRQGLNDLSLSQIPLLSATRGYFVEFNRSVAFDSSASGIAFPLTATVHTDDVPTIVGNVATLRDMAATARRLTSLSHLAVAPLGLYFPSSRQPQNFSRPLVAPWLAATLIHAAAAEITSMTLAEDVIQALTSDEETTVSPFLTRLIECAGLETRPIDMALPRNLHAVALGEAQQAPTRLLAVNLAAEPSVLSLASTSLFASNVFDVVTGAALCENEVDIELQPFAVACVELANR